MYLHLKCFI